VRDTSERRGKFNLATTGTLRRRSMRIFAIYAYILLLTGIGYLEYRINILESEFKQTSVQLALDESELKEQHKHIDLIGGGIQTLSYETDVLTEAIKGLK
jgi:cell division protein FtsB